MTTRKLAARAALAAITVSALGLFVATPASAHTNNLYTFAYNEEELSAWATLDRDNGDATLLPTSVIHDGQIMGAEVSAEVGYAIEEGEGYFGFTWDHNTGAETAPVPLFITDAEGLELVSGLDTRVDGTLVTYVEYDIFEGGNEFPTDHAAIATINFATGELTPVVFLDDLIFDDSFQWELISLATDPLSGVTYAFLEESSLSYFLPLDVPLGTFGTPQQFTGTDFEDGFFGGADFDGDGSLYFIYGNNEVEVYELSHVGAVSTWPTAAREYIGPAAGNLGLNFVEWMALTLEYTPVPEPVLAATGTEISGAWAGAAVVGVLGGMLVLLTTRRKARA